MSPQLVLSLFPGIGLLDMAFEEEGFCVVRGPDLLWGGDVKRFHPTPGAFEGIIGGPPCKRWSPLANVVRAVHGEASLAEDLIPEFARCVMEAGPMWFLMENVTLAPAPKTPGYSLTDVVLNNRWVGGEQNRVRRFTWGTLSEVRYHGDRILHVEQDALEHPNFEPAVTTNSGGRRAVAVLDANGRVRGHQGHADHHRLHGRGFARECELQGLPVGFLDDTPFTAQGKRIMVGNGVPLPMGRAVARAVKRALGIEAVAGVAVDPDVIREMDETP